MRDSVADQRPLLLRSSLGSIGAMPVLLALFLALTYWGGWEVGVYVLPFMIAHGALRRGATDGEALAVAMVVGLLIVGLLSLL